MLFFLFVIIAVLLAFFIIQYYSSSRARDMLNLQNVELQQHVQALSKAEKENAILAMTVKNIQECVVITDLNHKMIFVNDAFREHFGYIKSDLSEINMVDLLSPKNRPETFEPIKEQILNGGWKGEITASKKTGDEFPALLSTAVIYDQEKQPESLIFIIQDISKHVQLEKKYRQSQKVEAIGRLAGGVAHDFNNVLSIILGYSELAKKKMLLNGQDVKEIEKVLTAGNRAVNLVKQILTFSRQTSHKLEPIMPHITIKEALKFLRSSIPASILVIENIDEDCGEILADPTNIYQIIMNLCMNAVQAMENETGNLVVNLHEVEVDSEGQGRRSFVKLSVQDTGKGMDEPTMQMIFEPYFTTKEPGKGTGLGLSVIQGIIQDYGGFIKVESIVGKGSTFHVFFPLLELNSAREGETTRDTTLPGGTEHILLIDDEPEMVEIQGARLKALGYKVTCFTDSHMALKAFCAHPKNFDMILTDQSMPKLTGMELARRAMIVAPKIPIAILTGFSTSLSEEEGKAYNIRTILIKPITEETLAIQVRAILDQAE